MLQLQSRPLTLFLCDAAAVRECTALAATPAADQSPVALAGSRLLGAVCRAQVQACVKGRFFDRMHAKLDQLARMESNELVPIDVQAMALALVEATIIV